MALTHMSIELDQTETDQTGSIIHSNSWKSESNRWNFNRYPALIVTLLSHYYDFFARLSKGQGNSMQSTAKILGKIILTWEQYSEFARI